MYLLVVFFWLLGYLEVFYFISKYLGNFPDSFSLFISNLITFWTKTLFSYFLLYSYFMFITLSFTYFTTEIFMIDFLWLPLPLLWVLYNTLYVPSNLPKIWKIVNSKGHLASGIWHKKMWNDFLIQNIFLLFLDYHWCENT